MSALSTIIVSAVCTIGGVFAIAGVTLWCLFRHITAAKVNKYIAFRTALYQGFLALMIVGGFAALAVTIVLNGHESGMRPLLVMADAVVVAVCIVYTADFPDHLRRCLTPKFRTTHDDLAV